MDFLVFTHLRWDFVYQRPQHLLSRFANENRVFFWEEPERRHVSTPYLQVSVSPERVTVIVPVLPRHSSEEESWATQERLLAEFTTQHGIRDFCAWYYTPMARNFTRSLRPKVVVYDCMDELSAFRNAPAGLQASEDELFANADLVFTGGRSLYESKKSRHSSVHLFPSSIDARHFLAARRQEIDPPDQQDIPSPRLGYCGVIDERMDLALLAQVARQRSRWQIVMVGPVVKINPDDLPRLMNIHYLGGKSYDVLPSYLSGWDVGLLPFARNESTRFISPTKTPEYLAAGLPVVSTSIPDVVRPYGERKLASIADDPAEFITAVEAILSRDMAHESERLRRVDDFLAHTSWDRTFSEMHNLILAAAGILDGKGVETKVSSRTALPISL